MLDIAAAILPVFAIIALGAGLRRLDFPGEAFWPHLDRFTYFVVFPCFLFTTISGADLSGIAVGPMTAALLTAMAAMAALTFALKPWIAPSGPQFSSVFQGTVRWNGFIMLAIVKLTMGAEGLALAAVAFGALVPFANVLSVAVVSAHAGAGPPGPGRLLLLLLQNPLVIACAAGIASNLIAVQLPSPLIEITRTIGAAAVPLGLIAVGASLDLKAARASARIVAATSAIRLALMPLIMWATCLAFGITGPALAVCVIAAATPTAASAYVLARQLGGDAPLMANLITIQTLAAMATMPVAIGLLT